MVFTLTSIAMEVAVLFIIYRVVWFSLLKQFLKWVYSRRPWWDYLTTYEGLFTKNVQLEIVYISLLTSHHHLGGFLMLYAYVYHDPTMFAHAAMWELVDDINDMMCLLFVWWPFYERDLKMIFLMFSHHVAGVIIIVPALTRGLYLNRDFQFIGLSLLLAGGVSTAVIGISRTMDRRVGSEAWMDFFLWLMNFTFFVICRFYIFPIYLFRLFEKSVWQEITSGVTRNVICAGVVSMTLFDILIFLDMLGCTVTRLRIALNNGEDHDFSLACHCTRCLRSRNHELED